MSLWHPNILSYRRLFFSRVNFVCWVLFGVSSIPVLPHGHVNDSGHSTKSAGGRLHLHTHTPLTQRSRSGLTMPLSKNSVRTYPETSSHATCQGTFGHSRFSSLSRCGLVLAGIKSGISVHELISTSKQNKNKQKSAGGEWMVQHSPKILANEDKSQHHQHHR